MGEHDSTHEDLIAATRLASSRRVRTILIWIAVGAVWPAATATGGWIAAKLDTAMEIRELRAGLLTVTNAQTVLLKRLDELVHPETGLITRIRAEQIAQWREIAEAQAMAVAHETTARRDSKLRAGDRRGDSYDAELKKLTPPAAAYTAVVDKVASQ